MSQDQKKALGRILLEQRAITQAELDRALREQKPGSAPLATRLTEQGVITELEALKALSAQRGVPGIDLSQLCLRLQDLGALPRDIALLHKLLPVLEREDRIFCAMANPEDNKVIEELEFVTGKRVFAYIALEGPLLRVIREAYDARERGDSHYIGPACPADVLRRSGLEHLVGKVGAPDVPAAPPAVAPPRGPSANPVEARASKPAIEVGPTPVATASSSGRRVSAPTLPSRAHAAAARAVPAVTVESPSVAQVARALADPPAARPAPAVAPTAKSPRLGSSPDGRFRPSSSSFPAARSSVIVDEKMQRHVDAANVTESDFGDVAEEVSVVSEMPKSVPPAVGQKKLLVVDDEPEIRRMIRRVFEERGHLVIEADRGKLALQMVKLEAPDLVILDAMLPEVHGFDIARRIKGSSRYGHIPIVMVSAVYRGWRFAEDAKASYGVDAYVEKPFKVGELIATVEAALRAKKAPAVDLERMSAEAERLLKEGVAAYQLGEVDRATGLLESGVQIDPLAYRLRFHLGLLYGKRGQVYDAIEQLERAVEIQGQHFASVKNLAILYQQAGFRNKALEAWERALAAAPDDETKKSIKEHIVALL